MAKQEQVLIIEPQNELKFKGPFTSMITSYLKLTNPTDSAICFKIKTTAPKKYCVRPNSGVINPKETTSVAVCLQPFEYDPNEKNKHKFMVQSLIAPDGEINLEKLWKEASMDSYMDTKLKCVFELPETASSYTDPELINLAEEARRIGDSVPTSSPDGELMKAAKEVKHLREEESSLRQENIMLKEEVLSLTRQVDTLRQYSRREPSGHAGQLSNRQANQSDSFLQTPAIILAIVMALVGIILGKFLL